MWLYNKSAANDPSAAFPTGLDPDTPTGNSLSTLAEVSARNLTLLHQCRASVTGWREWYEGLKADWPVSQEEEVEEDG